MELPIFDVAIGAELVVNVERVVLSIVEYTIMTISTKLELIFF